MPSLPNAHPARPGLQWLSWAFGAPASMQTAASIAPRQAPALAPGPDLIGQATLAPASPGLDMAAVIDALTDFRAIQVMAMLLLIGFGFLMVFVRQYGRSALTATFLLVNLAIPLYLARLELLSAPGTQPPAITGLVLAEFAAASLLIAAGAVLGRLSLPQ